jgi:hypothetical protein
MNPPSLKIPDKAMYPWYLRTMLGILAFTFGIVAVLFLIQVVLNEGDIGVVAYATLFSSGGLTLIALVAHAFKSRAMRPQELLKLHEWTKTRYDVNLSARQVRKLSQPSTARSIPFDDWVSVPVVIFHRDESGSRTMLHVVLLRADNDWLLFCPELRGEYPMSPRLVQAEQEDFIGEAWKEISEHRGLYVVTPNTDDFTGEFVRAKSPQGKEIALFWSDQLRADLWINEAGGSRDWKARYMPLPQVVNELLPMIISENESVGLNWGEGARSFDSQWFAQRMIHQFPGQPS